MRQILDRVTITGADKRTDPMDLLRLSREYPFVEWGILLSKSSMGTPRFPNKTWLRRLNEIFMANPSMQLSGHLCGRWVRNFCKGNWSWMRDLNEPPIYVAAMFQRLQLNFHAIVHDLDRDKFFKGFGDEPLKHTTVYPQHVDPQSTKRQFIFQLDDVNNSILEEAQDHRTPGGNRIDAVPLFDLSGGTGVLPESWPVVNGYCGYAGGLSPDNVAEQLELIKAVVGDGPIWIDVETHVRTEDDQYLDLDKVVAFIEAALPWVRRPT